MTKIRVVRSLSAQAENVLNKKLNKTLNGRDVNGCEEGHLQSI